jgi:hypothetical protein
MWHWHNVKKAGDAFQKCIDDFFSSLPPIGNELCRDCKYSVFSKNNSNLVCLNGNSRNFGTTLAPDTDMLGYCYFERKDNDLDGAEENKGEKLCRISQ